MGAVISSVISPVVQAVINNKNLPKIATKISNLMAYFLDGTSQHLSIPTYTPKSNVILWSGTVDFTPKNTSSTLYSGNDITVKILGDATTNPRKIQFRYVDSTGTVRNRALSSLSVPTGIVDVVLEFNMTANSAVGVINGEEGSVTLAGVYELFDINKMGLNAAGAGEYLNGSLTNVSITEPYRIQGKSVLFGNGVDRYGAWDLSVLAGQSVEADIIFKTTNAVQTLWADFGVNYLSTRANTGLFYFSNANGQLGVNGPNNFTTDTYAPTNDEHFRVRRTFGTNSTFNAIWCSSGFNSFFTGAISNLKIYDTDGVTLLHHWPLDENTLTEDGNGNLIAEDVVGTHDFTIYKAVLSDLVPMPITNREYTGTRKSNDLSNTLENTLDPSGVTDATLINYDESGWQEIN